ncbi:MAG: chemotaxis protein CheD [Desulfohalobiaceae bacterium]|nr:chemotaxis protein CheD [Desulfohalobiaceae bacterium]MCF8085424.1 chemotaxis protein CheD [Desulfohalobiaceae bacterium]
MDEILLGLGDIGVSTDGRPIRTQGLGSCVAVSVWCPGMKAAGLVQIALPESRINPGKAGEKPGYFADTGIPALIAEIKGRGCKLTEQETEVKIMGGAEIMNTNDVFNIGEHNVAAVRRILSKEKLRVMAEEVGGHSSKTVTVFSKTGEVMLSSPGQTEWYI